MKILKAALIGLALVIGVLFATAFVFGIVKSVSELNNTKTTTTTTVKTPVENKTQKDTEVKQVTPSLRKSFMDGCDPNGTHTQFCACTIDYLDSHYSIVEILNYENDESMINKATAAC